MDGRQRCIENGRMRIPFEVDGYERFFLILQDPLQRSCSGFLERLVDLLFGRGLFDLDHEIHKRHVGGRHPDGEAVQLPFQAGSTRPIALAAPVEVGIMLRAAARARLRSLWGRSSSF